MRTAWLWLAFLWTEALYWLGCGVGKVALGVRVSWEALKEGYMRGRYGHQG